MTVDFGVNYLGVVVAAVAAIIFGFIYYAPQVMGKRWMALLGTTQAQLGNPGGAGMAAGVVASLVNAWVLAVLAKNLGGTTITDGIMLGIVCWLGFMATITLAEVSFTKQPWMLWVVNNTHNVIAQALMGAIVLAIK